MRKQNRMTHAPLGAANLRLLRAQARYGRPMKQDSGDHSGGGGNGQENNQGGNGGGQNGNGESGGNNGGTPFNADAFWNEPEPDGGAANGGTAPNNGNQGGGQSGGQQDDGNAFAQRLTGLTFGDNVFTPDAVEAMNNSDPSKFNENMTKFGRSAVKESVVMAAQLMQRNNELLQGQFKQMLDERFGQRDAESDLGKSFPSYNEPGMKPVIDGIFAQAMKLTKGNRAGAVDMTKEMLKHTSTRASKDLGINQAPGGPGDGQIVTNWEEELLGRS